MVQPLIPHGLRSQLDDPNLKALNLLEEVVSKSKNVEHIGGGRLLTRKGYAEVILYVEETLIHRLEFDDPHLVVTVGVTGHSAPLSHPCLLGSGVIPAADSCVSFVWMVDSGWPDEIVPRTLQSAIQEANSFANKEAIRRASKERRLRARTTKAHQFAEQCAGGLVSLAGDAESPRATAQKLWDRGYSDSMEGADITQDLLLRAARAAAEISRSGLDADSLNTALAPFLDRYSSLTINATIRELDHEGPEAEVLERYKRNRTQGHPAHP